MIIEHEAFRTAVKLGIAVLVGLYSVVVVLAIVALRLTIPELFGVAYSPPNQSVLTTILLVMFPFLAGSWFLPGFMAGWQYSKLHPVIDPTRDELARLGALTGSATSGLGYLFITLILLLLTLPWQNRWLSVIAQQSNDAFSLPFLTNLGSIWAVPLLMLSILVTMAFWTTVGAVMGAFGAFASLHYQKTGQFTRNPFQQSSEL